MKLEKSEIKENGDIVVSISFSRDEIKQRAIKEEREKSDKELLKIVGKVLMVVSKHT